MPLFHRVLVGAILIPCFLLGQPDLLSSQEESATDSVKTMTARWVNPAPPKIDGILDDETWQYAPAYGGFMQREPDEGIAPTESTTVQVVYDDEALYVGIMLYDSEPDKIVARLARRDRWTEADNVQLYLDSYHDHQTGYFFRINAAGSWEDGYLYRDTRRDDSWDGVWEARAKIHEGGWSAEFKIPYYVLRFSAKEKYTWGINVTRYISRKKEYDQWVLVRRTENGWVSRFGHLEGIQGIDPPIHLEFLPYSMGRSTFEPESAAHPNGRDFFSNLGGDLRYGVSSNFSLNATFNPDFGQVEADPAVLNLSVFETYFRERRPFFVEGAQTFRTPFQLFYSRRIGRRPGHFSLPSGNTQIDRPEFTTILSAAKLTGKTESKTNFGILEAVTANEYATIESTYTDPLTGDEQTVRRHHKVEPLTNYFVGRVQQDLLDGNSTVGLLVTAVNRKDAEAAYTGGVDWDLKLRNNAYRISGQVAGSRAGPQSNRQSGYATQIELAKTSGWFLGELRLEALSPKFDANDLGFIRRVDFINPEAWLRIQKTQPWGPFRRIYFNLNSWSAWTYKGFNLWKGMNFNYNSELMNFWWIYGGGNYSFETLDDLDTRGGPPIVNPASTNFFGGFGSDSRKAVRVSLFGYGGFSAGGSSWRGINPSIRMRPATNIDISIYPRYNWNFDHAQWVTNVDDDGDGIKDHYVYGELTSQVLSITARADVTFSRDLSLELYLQPFVAVGKYANFKELARPSSYEFTPYSGVDFDPNFKRRSLRSNMVIRWEYRPGSTLFLVWSQSRSAFSRDPSFQPWHNVGSSFTDQGSNIFLVKLNYWLSV